MVRGSRWGSTWGSSMYYYYVHVLLLRSTVDIVVLLVCSDITSGITTIKVKNGVNIAWLDSLHVKTISMTSLRL